MRHALVTDFHDILGSLCLDSSKVFRICLLSEDPSKPFLSICVSVKDPVGQRGSGLRGKDVRGRALRAEAMFNQTLEATGNLTSGLQMEHLAGGTLLSF